MEPYAYDAYGMLLDGIGADANPYRYRGKQYDAELGAYYLRARYYQPETRRFTIVDPFEGTRYSPITQHRYLYGNADPVNHLDPSGKFGLMELMAVTGMLSEVVQVGAGAGAVGGIKEDIAQSVLDHNVPILKIPLTYTKL